jgi:N-acetylneuraminate synthase/N,N'-diacetyllegionaminate synthase
MIVTVEQRPIGAGHPVFVIAEAGVNHNGDLDLARRLVDVAAGAGADAVKFQTFAAERVAAREAPKAEYQRQTTSADESQQQMLRRLELSPAAHRELQAHARSRGVVFLSTPFDEASADLLDALDVPAIKIGSGEVTNLPFLEHVARKGRPVILSTGMSSLDEVGAAVAAVRETGNRDLILLHCVSEYPARAGDANVRAMLTLADTFRTPVGYSDHTPGLEVALAAVALGAAVIEKHFTVDRTLPGPDHRASLEPAQLTELVRSIRVVEQALGDGIKAPTAGELGNRIVARRSLAAAVDLPAGLALTRESLCALRPATGISPASLPAVLGRKLTRARRAGELIAWSDLE